MSTSTILQRHQYKRATWKNGLGYTDEIAIFPKNADLRRGDFLWRVSSARIEQASAFSAFPEHDRILVVLQGAGVRLIHTFEESGDVDSVEIPLLEPYEFPGDVPSRCELIDGPIQDLSIFVSKGQVDAVVDVRNVEEELTWVPAGNWNFAFAVNQPIQVTSPFDTHPFTLNQNETLSVDLSAPMSEETPFRLSSPLPGTKIVLISFQK